MVRGCSALGRHGGTGHNGVGRRGKIGAGIVRLQIVGGGVSPEAHRSRFEWRKVFAAWEMSFKDFGAKAIREP